MSIIVADLEGTLSAGSTWRGVRTYFKQHYNPWAYNLFFLNWLPRYPLVRFGLVEKRKEAMRWMVREIGLFRGESPAKLEAMSKWVVENELWPNRRREVVEDIRSRIRADEQVAVVTGAYQPLADAFARRLNGVGIGTQLHYENERLVGLITPINHGRHKVENIRARFDCAPILAAYGDTISDAPMLEISQEPVAVHPDDGLRQIAQTRGWRIIERVSG